MPATRKRYRLVGAAAATLAVTAVTPATVAHANASASVSPGVVAPGSRVSLSVTGCSARTARASSSAFGDVQLSPGNAQATRLSGSAIVFGSAATGSYPVTFQCGGTGGERVTVTLTVSLGAARGGLGGSVDTVGTTPVAIGGALVASALGAGLWVLRRRRETHV
ncbi:hypothetical protein ACIA6C_02555 [Streptomyces sp. NPDC051578]|uniref:hypothetical protein n=1 Tax=Streptomyces sp. NPDC051578 TaxID=3365662 RepID=UPI0037879C0B